MIKKEEVKIFLISFFSLLSFISASATPAAFAQEQSCVSSSCHASLGKDKVVHSPVKDGSCTACHQAVQDPGKQATHPGNLIITLVQDGNKLCYKCHPNMEEGLKTKKVAHPPAKQSCILCHDQHGSPYKAMLKDPVPLICSSCHPNESGLAKKAITKHGPMTDENSCMNCHGPHFSDQQKLLRIAERDLCLSCHNKELDTESGKIKDLKAFLETNKGGQGPLKGKACSACHSPHGSDYWRLLSKYYTPAFYSSYSDGIYALCLGCHNSAAFTERKTTKATNFRDGQRNLHYIHVNKIVKGRTCRDCHDACSECQSSGLPKQMKEAVSFGGWKMPVNFAPGAQGGSCVPGCHAEKQYTR